MRKIMLAAAVITLLTTMTALTSCIDSDNDTANGGETSSAVDEGLWPVPADAADSTYRPGDDFFMFCNGGFWKNTTVDESIAENHCWAFNEVEELMNQRMSAISVPSLVKMKADATHRDDATVKAQRERLQSAIDRLAAAQTLEEAWRLTGQLMKEGYRTPFALNLCSRKGRMGAFITITAHPNDFAASMLPTGDERLSWRMMNDARLQASLKPLKGGTTRSFDTEKWPMLRYIFEGLGIPLDNAYVIEELPDKNVQFDIEFKNVKFGYDKNKTILPCYFRIVHFKYFFYVLEKIYFFAKFMINSSINGRQNLERFLSYFEKNLIKIIQKLEALVNYFLFSNFHWNYLRLMYFRH